MRRLPETSVEADDKPQPSEEVADRAGKQRVQSDTGKTDLIKNPKLTRVPPQM